MTSEAYAPTRRIAGILTARYQDAFKARVEPVRITLYPPRWVREELVSIPMLAPTKAIFSVEDDAEFERLYRERLERSGVDRIRGELERAQRTAGDRPIALCCYEDLTKPGECCHRTMFARWWQEQTGEEIPELSSLPVDDLRVVWPDRAVKVALTEPSQGGLF